jgi:hypothetical protein
MDAHGKLKAMAVTTTLFRPTGEKELELIRSADWRAFPPRLPEQPIFYPVLEESYAVQIARDWNTRDSGTGYVLRFQWRPSTSRSIPCRPLELASIASIGSPPKTLQNSIGTLLAKSNL